MIKQITEMTFGFMSVGGVQMLLLALVSEFRGENS